MKRPLFDGDGNFINDGSPLFIGAKVQGGTPHFRAVRQDYVAACRDSESPIARMVKDPVMFRQIKNGNASDKYLKRDAEYLQVAHHEKKKEAEKREQFKRVERAREKYKRRYKKDPI